MKIYPFELSSCSPESTETSLYCRNLNGNKIQRIPFGVFDNTNSLRTLQLDSNSLSCDCEMLWLVKYLQVNKRRLVSSGNCTIPGLAQKKLLNELNEADFHCS